MPSDATVTDGTGQCSWCLEDRETRPVCVVEEEDPRLLCDRCYRALDAVSMIDHERDKEVFGYG